MSKLKRSWALFKRSMRVILDNKKLLVFPLFVFVFMCVIVLFFLAPIVLLMLFSYLGLGVVWIWLVIASIINFSALVTWRYSRNKLNEAMREGIKDV